MLPHEQQPDLFRGRAIETMMASPECEPVGRRHSLAGTNKTRLRADLGRAEHFEEIRKLEPLALTVGAARPNGMFTMADVRTEAERIGWLTGEEGRPDVATGRLTKPRALAYLGALLPGLARIGLVQKMTDASGRTVYDTSSRERANGNKQALWRVTDQGRDVIKLGEIATSRMGGRVFHRIAEMIKGMRESGVHHG